jgi:hypothetical protein
VEEIGQMFAGFGFRLPLSPVHHVPAGLKFLGVVLVMVIPFGLSGLAEAETTLELW